jgi:hypothetical protein
MRFMLLQNYGPVELDCAPMSEWEPGSAGPHRLPGALNQVLSDSGELVDAQGLAGPDEAKFVVATDAGAVITDGPYPESKAAGRLPDHRVDTLERALEIAARASAAPGPGGASMVSPWRCARS